MPGSGCNGQIGGAMPRSGCNGQELGVQCPGSEVQCMGSRGAMS